MYGEFHVEEVFFLASKATAACYCIPIPILAGGSTVNELHAIVLVLTQEYRESRGEWHQNLFITF